MVDLQNSTTMRFFVLVFSMWVGITIRHFFPPVRDLSNIYLQYALVILLSYIVFVLTTWMLFDDGPVYH